METINLNGARVIRERAEELLAQESREYLTRELDRAYWQLRHKFGEEVANDAASKLPTIVF